MLNANGNRSGSPPAGRKSLRTYSCFYLFYYILAYARGPLPPTWHTRPNIVPDSRKISVVRKLQFLSFPTTFCARKLLTAPFRVRSSTNRVAPSVCEWPEFILGSTLVRYFVFALFRPLLSKWKKQIRNERHCSAASSSSARKTPFCYSYTH